MIKNKKISYNIILKNFIRILTLILCGFYLINHEDSHISGGLIFLITSLGVDIALRLIKIKLTNFIDLIVQIFIFLCLFLGKMYNIYAVFPWWDSFLHFISGIIIGLAGVLILRIFVPEKIFHNLSPLFKGLYGFIVAVASSALWEIWEFAGDQLFGLDSQLNSLMDTMTDICVCTVGGLIIGLIIYEFYKREKFKFIGKAVESFAVINSKEKPNKF